MTLVKNKIFHTPQGRNIKEYQESNALYVSSYGDDNATISRADRLGKPWKAYLTITEAVAAAVVGDLIVVFPGDYTDYNILKNGVDYYFYPGASIVATGKIFEILLGDSKNCNIYGRGNFKSSNSVVNFVDSNSTIYMEFDKLETTNEITVLCAGVKATFIGDSILSSGTAWYNILITGASVIYMHARIYKSTSSYSPYAHVLFFRDGATNFTGKATIIATDGFYGTTAAASITTIFFQRCTDTSRIEIVGNVYAYGGNPAIWIDEAIVKLTGNIIHAGTGPGIYIRNWIGGFNPIMDMTGDISTTTGNTIQNDRPTATVHFNGQMSKTGTDHMMSLSNGIIHLYANMKINTYLRITGGTLFVHKSIKNLNTTLYTSQSCIHYNGGTIYLLAGSKLVTSNPEANALQTSALRNIKIESVYTNDIKGLLEPQKRKDQVTITGGASVTSTVTVNGVAYSSSVAAESDRATAIAAAIQAGQPVTASSVGAIITIEANVAGTNYTLVATTNCTLTQIRSNKFTITNLIAGGTILEDTLIDT